MGWVQRHFGSPLHELPKAKAFIQMVHDGEINIADMSCGTRTAEWGAFAELLDEATQKYLGKFLGESVVAEYCPGDFIWSVLQTFWPPATTKLISLFGGMHCFDELRMAFPHYDDDQASGIVDVLQKRDANERYHRAVDVYLWNAPGSFSSSPQDVLTEGAFQLIRRKGLLVIRDYIGRAVPHELGDPWKWRPVLEIIDPKSEGMSYVPIRGWYGLDEGWYHVVSDSIRIFQKLY